MVKNLYKFSLIALAMIAAGTISYGATVYQAEYNTLDLDDHPMIVTNVTFDGLATLVDVTNIVNDVSTNFVTDLRKEIADASEAGTNYVDSATNRVLSAVRSKTDLDVYEYPVVYGYWTTGEGGSMKEYRPASRFPEKGGVYKWSFDSTDYMQYNPTTGNLYRKVGVTSVTFNVDPALDPRDPEVSFDAVEMLGDLMIYHAAEIGDEPTPTGDTLAKKSEVVPVTRTINGAPLSADVVLTGANIKVSGSDDTTIDAALADKATKADATLVNASDWVCSPAKIGEAPVHIVHDQSGAWYPSDGGSIGMPKGDAQSLSLSWAANEWYGGVALTATRVALNGYVLGSQTNKLLASEAEAEEFRTELAGVEDALQMKYWYPDGSVKSSLEWTSGLKYSYDEVAMTAAVLPFCNTGTATNDNSDLVGKVVIPPYVVKDGVRYSVTSLAQGVGNPSANSGLTEIIAPSTVVGISDNSVRRCTNLVSISFPGEVSVGQGAFYGCASLSEVSLPLAHTMAGYVFDGGCKALTKVDFPSCTTIIGGNVFKDCQGLEEVYLPVFTNKIGGSFFSGCGKLIVVNFGAVQRNPIPTLDNVNAFNGVPKPCVIVVPDTNYVAWTTANKWRDLVTAGYRFLRHSEWECARRYEIDSLLCAQYYPDGSVKSSAEFTPGIKYDAPDTVNRTITVKPFCNTGTATYDNSSLSGRVVIPPFVDAQGNGYIFDDGTRFKVVGVSYGLYDSPQNVLTAVVAPTTMTNIADSAFYYCTSLASVSLPAATRIENDAFYWCSSLTSISLPAATDIGSSAFWRCTSLESVSLPAATRIKTDAFYWCSSLTSISLPAATDIGSSAFWHCTSLESVDFGATPRATVPTLGRSAFNGVPTYCRIIVPDAQYDDWTAASGWSSLVTQGYKFLKHSEWEYARRYELYDKASKSEVYPLLFAQYYPEGNVKSAEEFTTGIKYDAPDTTNRTITVKTFCNTGTATNDNSSLSGRVVIPPFVDASGNGCISDDGTRFRVVGVGGGSPDFGNSDLTAIVAPNTVTNVGDNAFSNCDALTSVSLPAATSIGSDVFVGCIELASVSLPAATTIGDEAFAFCTRLSSVDFGDTPRSSVPTLGTGAFLSVKPSCKIIVPYTQYDAWIVADGWKDLPQEFVRHAEKADKPATFTTGNLAALDANGNPTDSGIAPSAKRDYQDLSLGTAINAWTQRGREDHPLYTWDTDLNCWRNTNGGGDKIFGPRFVRFVESTDSYIDPATGDAPIYTVYGSSGDKIGSSAAPNLDLNLTTGHQFYVSNRNNNDSIATQVSLSGKANRAANPTDGNLAALDANGNPTDSGIAKTNLSGSSVKLGLGASVGSSGSSDPLSVAIGNGAKVQSSSPNSVAIGNGAEAGTQGAGDTGSATAIGNTAKATAKSSVAIGSGAKVTATAAVQIGYSATANNEEKSLRFRDTMVVGGDGKIPTSSLLDFPALESVPDRTIAASTAYSVGDAVGDGGKAYRCKVAYTSAANPVTPSSDTTHWEEVPALKDVYEQLLFAQYYPDGNVKSAAEFTTGIKYNAPDTTNRTITVKPFCNTGTVTNDNSNLSGRVVIPPFVDAQRNGYISDDGTRFKVVGVSEGIATDDSANLTAIVAPTTVTTIGDDAFASCTSLASVSLPAATSIGCDAFGDCTSLASVSLPAAMALGDYAFALCTSLASVSLPAVTAAGANAFASCTSLASISLPAATSIGWAAFDACTSLESVSLPAVTAAGANAFASCTSLASVSLPAATSIGYDAFDDCTSLASVDFGDTPRSSVPTLGADAFSSVPTTCKITVPDAQYEDWIAATDGWEAIKLGATPSALSTRGSLAYAYANGNYTVNGIEFSAASGSSGIDNENCSVNIAYSAGNVPPSDVESGGYKDLLSHGWWASAGSRTVTLRNLTAGHNYIVQIVLSRSDYQTQTATSPDWTAVAKFGGEGWEYGSVLSGVFMATGSTETLSIAYSGGSWINGIQVRDLGSSGPGHNYWHDLYVAGYKFLRHSEWEYARRYEIASILAGESMPAAPTQNELAEAVKKIFRALGGTVLNKEE